MVLGKKKTEKHEEIEFFTGLEFCLYNGTIYNHTWFSFIIVISNTTLIALAFLHYILKIVLHYETLSVLDVAELSHYALLDLSYLTMGSSLLLKSDEFLSLCNILDNEFKNPKIKRSMKVKEKYERTFEYLVKFVKISISVTMFALFITYIRKPLFEADSDFTIPYNGWIPFIVDSWPKYIAVCLFQMVIGISVSIGQVCLMLTYVIQSTLICVQCEILMVHLKETFDPTMLSELNNREESVRIKMKLIINHHQSLLGWYKKFVGTYYGLLLSVGLISGFIICTVIYIITNPEGTLIFSLEFAVLMTPELLLVGAYCIFGQQLSDKWAEIRSFIFELDWFNASIITQKDLLMILIGNNRDFVIKPLGLQEFSLKGFSELLQGAFSLFNMMKAMR